MSKPTEPPNSVWRWAVSYWLAAVFAWVKDLANMLIGGVLPVYEVDNTELWPVTPDLRVMMGVEG